MKNGLNIKYLIANEQDIQWGLTVNTAGYQQVEPHSTYPPRNHPSRYLFSTEKGRILNEYQLLYITKGSGHFMSANHKRIPIKEGNMILLFPGEWHNYRPDPNTGWDEYWIGFNGVNIDKRIETGFFSKQKPIFNLGIHDEIVTLYKQAIDVAKNQNTGFQQMLAGIVNYILGYAYSYDRHCTFEDLKVVNQINKAKILFNELLHTSIQPEAIARQVNMSYSWFRRIFKQYTGFAPAQYLQEIRIQKSKVLLTNTSQSIKNIAYEVGYENPDYFCTVFKKRTGITAMHYREFTQGKNL
ncbi:AraC family transcriptional regulator [Coprobacter tertius]|uniref:AraC family transcriptional regulator n=1 Tax=Coprobacter tertius TaxID=2944915 RepID=A0ABT1MDF3_9BACT|nr:AraC family transcriptional regulator [Coprobacter tertius]MCP9610668.1 AraC family transcriptional regulator [Coprobacter tertius]